MIYRVSNKDKLLTYFNEFGLGEIMNYTYILECSDGSYYTGWTNDLNKRIEKHNGGTGAKYTKGRRPVKLKYYEEFESKQEAMKREYEIKKLLRKDKDKLIKDYNGRENISKKV